MTKIILAMPPNWVYYFHTVPPPPRLPNSRYQATGEKTKALLKIPRDPHENKILIAVPAG